MTEYKNTPSVCVGIVPTTKGVLTIRRYGVKGPISRAFPGGFQMQGETIEQAVVREIKEETGLYLNPSSFYPVHVVTTPDRKVNLIFLMHSYEIDLDDSGIVFTPQEGEVTAVETIRSWERMMFPLHEEQLTKFFDNAYNYAR